MISEGRDNKELTWLVVLEIVGATVVEAVGNTTTPWISEASLEIKLGTSSLTELDWLGRETASSASSSTTLGESPSLESCCTGEGLLKMPGLAVKGHLSVRWPADRQAEHRVFSYGFQLPP